MKKSFLIIIILLASTQCFADEYYIFIEKIGYVELGQEAGHNEKGDVIEIAPATVQYKPTKTELDSYIIIKADLTDLQRKELLEYEYFDSKGLTNDDIDDVIIKSRKRKIDIDKLGAKQEEKVSVQKLTTNIITK